MKIKLAVLDIDENYLKKLTNAFNSKYSDKIEIYGFTNLDSLMEVINVKKIDVLIAGENFDIDTDIIPKKCGFAYFVETQDVEKYNNQRAICKFQKAEHIYKQVLSIFSETAGSTVGMQYNDETSKIIVFTSPAGGVGTTSVAIACATNFAKKGMKTLYLNLEKFGTVSSYLTTQGQFNMSDIIYSVKSKKVNLAMKIESAVRQSGAGVYYFSESKSALDMYELKDNDVNKLISELRIAGEYDYIILDADFGLDEYSTNILKQSNKIVFISDGIDISNSKLKRAYEAICALDTQFDSSLANRINIINNKYVSKSVCQIENVEVKNIGKIPKYEYINQDKIIEQISNSGVFSEIM